MLALSTGARQGELLGLRWSDLDWQRQVAVVHDTKNRERRALPVTGHALELLQELAEVRRIDSDVIFAGPTGKATYPRKAWEKALRAAQIDDFRFHDLRHSAASYLAMNGATLAEIAEVLGHKTLAMVKRYSHLTEAPPPSCRNAREKTLAVPRGPRPLLWQRRSSFLALGPETATWRGTEFGDGGHKAA